MNPRATPLGLVPWLLTMICIAGIVHICSILLMPSVAAHDARARLAETAKSEGITVLAQPEPGKIVLPFSDPALAVGTCPFDLTRGPLHLRANADGESLLLLSFRDNRGRLFYSTTDRAALKGKIDILVVNAQQLDALEANDSDEQAAQELRLQAPGPTGLIIVRALAERGSDMAQARARVSAIACETVARKN